MPYHRVQTGRIEQARAAATSHSPCVPDLLSPGHCAVSDPKPGSLIPQAKRFNQPGFSSVCRPTQERSRPSSIPDHLNLE